MTHSFLFSNTGHVLLTIANAIVAVFYGVAAVCVSFFKYKKYIQLNRERKYSMIDVVVVVVFVEIASVLRN